MSFVTKFIVLLVVYYIVAATPCFDRLLFSYLHANAWMCSFILNSMGEDTNVSGLTVHSHRFTTTVQRGCDAVEPTWLFCAAVLSCRASWIRRLLGMALGAAFLQGLNLMRLVSLYWIAVSIPSAFDRVHMEIWPVAFIMIAILLFYTWKSRTLGWKTNAPM